MEMGLKISVIFTHPSSYTEHSYNYTVLVVHREVTLQDNDNKYLVRVADITSQPFIVHVSCKHPCVNVACWPNTCMLTEILGD